MNRRDLLGLSLAAVGGVFVPRFGLWFRSQPPLGYVDSVGGIRTFGGAYTYHDLNLVGFDADGFTLDVRQSGTIKYTYRTGLFTPDLTGPVTLHAPRVVAYAL